MTDSGLQNAARIDGISYLRNIGRFESVRGGRETAFGPVTLIYSENGRGKTTLCATLQSLSSGDPGLILERRRLSATTELRAVIQIAGNKVSFDGTRWNSAGLRIAVFDELFVDSNIHSGLSVNAGHRKGIHELVVGEQGVRLQRRVEDLTTQISLLQDELRKKEKAIPAAALGSLSVEEFCALTRIKGLDTEIEITERSLSVARDSEAIQRKTDFRPFALPALNLVDYESLLGFTITDLEVSAVDAVQRHLSRLGAGGERWTSEGLGFLEDNESCPFCGQDITDVELISHYRGYFSDAYSGHKRRVQEAREHVAVQWSGDRLAEFQRTLQQEKEKREFWTRYAEIPEFNLDFGELATAWTALREALLAALDAKAAAPVEPISLTPEAQEAARRYTSMATSIQGLARALVGFNDVVAQTKEHAVEGSPTGAQQRLDRLRAVQRRFEADIDLACQEYLRVKGQKVSAEKEKEQARKELDEHRTQVFSSYELAINRFLDTFNADFTLDDLKPSDARGIPSSTFGIRVNGRSVGLNPPEDPSPSFRTALSSGDRNTLALAFFFASLEQLDLAESIVVIDDPISSLDDARAFATVQEIRKLEGRCRQLIVLSHSRTLLCQLWERADRDRTATLEIRDDGVDRSTLTPWDIEAAAVTEFDRLHRLVSDYGRAYRGDPQKVAPALRILLESFLRVAFVAIFPPGNQLGQFIQRAKQALSSGRPILPQEELQELDDLREYANRFHHSTNRRGWLEAVANVNERELRGFANRVLRFTTLDGRLRTPAGSVLVDAEAQRSREGSAR